MCLSEEFWNSAPQRLQERLENGLSIKEAESNLQHYHSTVYPIAIETAKFILEYWNNDNFSRLSDEAKEVIKEIKCSLKK